MVSRGPHPVRPYSVRGAVALHHGGLIMTGAAERYRERTFFGYCECDGGLASERPGVIVTSPHAGSELRGRFGGS